MSAESYREWINIAKDLGYEGDEIKDFVKNQRDIEECRRKEEIEEKKRVDERDREERRLQREAKQNELALRKIELELQKEGKTQECSISEKVRLKLPCFDDKVDEMDAFIRRFENFCVSQGVPDNKKCLHLSSLLTGKALKVYWRLPQSDVSDYNKLKTALLKRFKLSADGYRNKFCSLALL